MLDLGAGTGRTTSHIADLGNTVIGSDISPKMVKRAKELHPDIRFDVIDACNLPYEKDSQDAVVFSFNGIDCIYPESERMKALKEIKRVLKPDGIFIFSTHDAEKLKSTNRNWRRRPRRYRGCYMKELTVYGDLIVYYGKVPRNLNNLRAAGFRDPKYYSKDGRTWRYYVTWA